MLKYLKKKTRNQRSDNAAVPHRKTVFAEPLAPPTNHRPVFLFPSAVPESNQRTHACPPAKPGRNTLPSPPVPHHPQILILGSADGGEGEEISTPPPPPPPPSAICRLASLLQNRPVSQLVTSLPCLFVCLFVALAPDSSG